MSLRTLSEKHVSDAILERQMRNWEIARSQIHETAPEPVEAPVTHDFITLSRSAGLPGDLLAQRLHERLGWPVYDRDILRAMAGNDACREEIFRVLDERAEDWIQAFVRGFMQPAFVGREAYFKRLVETVAALSHTAPGIFIGRGVDLILPRDAGLRIRLSACRTYCAERYAHDHSISVEDANDEIEDIERDRARFIKQNFHIMPDDPTRFDMILNLEWIRIEEAVGLVIGLMKERGIEVRS